RGRKADTERIGAQRRPRPTRRYHVWLRTGQVDADQAGFDKHFHIVGIPPTITLGVKSHELTSLSSPQRPAAAGRVAHSTTCRSYARRSSQPGAPATR